jgi:hypothetical protein
MIEFENFKSWCKQFGLKPFKPESLSLYLKELKKRL